MDVMRKHTDYVRQGETPYTICEPDAAKASPVEYDSLEFDAQMAKLITKSWADARKRQANYIGYGNLPVLAELHVPWPPYVRPRHEHSVQEDGLQVPLENEVSDTTAKWLQNGRRTLGTIINRASMFDLHRTHVKKLRISSRCTRGC